ncbi:DUF1700 domain-containing protein [Paenibacillus barcinonensis]|uniref:DUF1700 domain-containing protein n=1 Tax=Paenibacillus barcinonensis TaxID=198119 RepID=A0A2V4VC61_PAEBA|nr:DUF1700 domain-containing protein [Paenibacillus barcinonensis]PYE50813.1 putative membrane protein [Paenibacillus barcinonensis]QKS57485.1 DUF1700 domain-containing protein [Paenibacillus barcinonensis]
MNKQQFMQAMALYLRPMDEVERSELLADYDQHFALGLHEGRTEEEIARELGHPEQIAKEALGDRYDAHIYSDIPATDPFYAPTFKEMKPVGNYTRATRSFFTAVGLLFLNLMFFIPIGLTLWSVWLTIAGMSLLALAPLAAAADALLLNHLDKAEMFVSIGLLGVGILFAIASKYVFRAFKVLTVAYIRWNHKIMRGDAPA